MLIGSVIIDTIDELQRITDMIISSTDHRYWGDMLKKMQAVVNAARRVNAHVAFIGHTKEVEHMDENGKELSNQPR